MLVEIIHCTLFNTSIFILSYFLVIDITKQSTSQVKDSIKVCTVVYLYYCFALVWKSVNSHLLILVTQFIIIVFLRQSGWPMAQLVETQGLGFKSWPILSWQLRLMTVLCWIRYLFIMNFSCISSLFMLHI